MGKVKQQIRVSWVSLGSFKLVDLNQTLISKFTVISSEASSEVACLFHQCSMLMLYFQDSGSHDSSDKTFDCIPDTSLQG